MKKVLLASCLALFSLQAAAGSVRGYVRKDGTYVAPYQRSAPDSRRWNNYGSQTMGGNQRDEFSSPPAYNQPQSTYGGGYSQGPNFGSDGHPKADFRSGY